MDKVHGSNRYTLLKYTLYKIYLIRMSVLVVFCTTLVGSTNKTDCHKKTEFYVFKNDALFVTGTHEPWGGGDNISINFLFIHPLVEQELLTLPEHLNSPPVLSGFVLLDL